MDGVLEGLEDALSSLRPTASSVPFYSSVTGEPVTGPSPRAKLTGPQSRSFGRGASPSHLSFRPPMAKAVGVARRQQLF